MQPKSEQGIIRPILGLLMILSLVLLGVPYVLFGKVVPPDKIGVRRNFFGVPPFLEGGFSAVGLPPGLHWQLPHVSQVELIPRGLQYVSFSEADVSEGRELPPLQIPTTDGSKVKNDVTLIFRLFDKSGKSELTAMDHDLTGGDGLEVAPKSMRKEVEHGGPRQLIERYTANLPDITEKFAQRAENELRQSLSRLSTSDYYNPRRREESALIAHDKIAESVAKEGIELFGTLVRRYIYAEQKIDDQIFAKNLQDQTERLNAAASKLSAAKAETERQTALWDARIRSSEVEGDTKVQVIESEAKLYEAQKSAEGDLLVATSRAEVDGERAKVLSEIAGADVYVARELAPLLRTLKGGVLSNVDPYDVDSWIQKLLGGEKK